jgi:hypothetical protein
MIMASMSDVRRGFYRFAKKFSVYKGSRYSVAVIANFPTLLALAVAP